MILALVFSGCSDDPDPPADPADAGMGNDSRDAAAQDASSSDAGLPPVTEACPLSAASPVFADINGDGVMDIADAIALQNNFFRGGREFVCREAADFNGDGQIQVDDSYRITTHLVGGGQPARALSANACRNSLPWPEGQCTPAEFRFFAPARTTESRFRARMVIRGDLRVQGWSTSLEATDCTLVQVATAGTSAGEIWDEPPGVRHLGYDMSRLVEGGALSYVILSFNEDIELPRGPSGTEVLEIELEADVPESGCRPCSLKTIAGLTWLGQPIDRVIVSDGYSYRPAESEVTIDVCAP